MNEKFNGLKIEPHGVYSETQQVCVAYREGKRVGVLYFNGDRLRLVFEEDEQVWIEKRTQPLNFERVYENKGVA
jgi:hypothetical protein